MNEDLKKITQFIESADNLSEEDKSALLKSAKTVDDELTVTAFKLQRTEKVKKTTSILLEETIEELEKKRKIVEEKVRESQIEVSLERVRAKAMAMHNSEDLALTVDLFFSELKTLNVKPRRCGVGVVNGETRIVEITSTTATEDENDLKLTGKLKLADHPVLDEIFTSWKHQKEYFPVLRGNEIKDYYQIMNPQIEFPNFSDDEIQYGYYFFFKEGGVFVWTENELLEEEINIFRRFTSVLSLTYRRYIDLKEAEAQAREAQIEAALERVRSKTMAMHNSQDVGDTVVTLFDEVLKLGLDNSIRCGIGILEGNEGMETWSATSHPDGEVDLKMGMLDMTIHPMLIGLKKAWESGKTDYSYDYIGDDVLRYYEALNNEPEYPFQANLDSLPENEYHKSFFYTEGILFSFAPNPISDEAANILNRFAGVFGQTYRRYLDLQKAEAQAREAQIEAALERVRSRSMGMHKSNELAEVVAVLYEQMEPLGLATWGCEVIFCNEEANRMELWHSDHVQSLLPECYIVPMINHPVLERQWKAWKENETSLIIELKGKEKLDFDNMLFEKTDFQNLPENIKKDIQSMNSIVFSHVSMQYGLLEALDQEALSDDKLKILERFAHVFEQTYTRFLDIKKVEEQNVIIQAENERKTQELEEARELQLAMLPKELPAVENIEIAVYMKTATEVGGDYYDFSFKDDGSINIGLGDATGHGMKAGTLVAMMKSLFTGNSAHSRIEDFFTTCNGALKNSMLERMMFAFVMINVNGNSISLVNAGQPPVYIYDADKKAVDEITVHGMPLGAMRKATFTSSEYSLQKNDVILLITDGMPELKNSDNEMYGYERLKSAFENNADKSADEIINVLKDEGSNWINDKDPDDDVSFIVVKFK